MLIETATVVERMGRRDVVYATNYGIGDIMVEVFTEKGEWVTTDVIINEVLQNRNLDIRTRFTPAAGTYVQIL